MTEMTSYFFPCSWVNKLNDINGIEKNYEIALCILKEGQRKSGTVGRKKVTRSTDVSDILTTSLVLSVCSLWCTWHLHLHNSYEVSL